MSVSSKGLSATIAASIFAAPVFAETRTYDFTGFDQISISSGLEAEIIAGPEFGITAEARNARILRKLEIEMRGHTLYISQDSSLRDLLFGADTDIMLTITLPELREVSIGSGVDARVSGSFGANFSGAASGGAALEIKGLTSTMIDIDVSSGASVDIIGTCDFLEVSVSSGAVLGAEGLVCDAVEVSASSGASATVFAASVLDSSASSGGSVDVYGAPAQTDISDSSGGDTRLRN